MSKNLNELFGEPIYTYTRAQAIADGVLVDVSVVAQGFGFRIPVAVTAGVWADCVFWTPHDSAVQTHQDEVARLRDVLWMAYHAAKAGPQAQVVPFQVLRVPRDGMGKKPFLTRLKMCVGPGDVGEPVITILLPNED